MSEKNITKNILNKFKYCWSRPFTDKTTIPLISKDDIIKVCNKSIELLKQQALYIELGCPLTIIGDIHGSLNDLFRIFRLFRLPPSTNYLFLGDYVDRGNNSVAAIVLLLCLFCEHPIEVTLLRGNHEFSHINKYYGFYSEIMKEYADESIWTLFQEVFSYLPLVAIVNKEIFCVHGGISPRIKTLKEIQLIMMPFKSYSEYPPVADLVWSDPVTAPAGFENNYRGSGYTFGGKATEEFLKTNKLKLIVRAHQCNMKGVLSFANEMGVTVFSSSNYGGTMRNRCGVMKVGSDRKIYFFSLGKDTEKAAKASIIMTLGNDLGLKLPDTKEALEAKNASAECENDALHPYIKFLREDRLLDSDVKSKSKSSTDEKQSDTSKKDDESSKKKQEKDETKETPKSEDESLKIQQEKRGKEEEKERDKKHDEKKKRRSPTHKGDSKPLEKSKSAGALLDKEKKDGKSQNSITIPSMESLPLFPSSPKSPKKQSPVKGYHSDEGVESPKLIEKMKQRSDSPQPSSPKKIKFSFEKE